MQHLHPLGLRIARVLITLSFGLVSLAPTTGLAQEQTPRVFPESSYAIQDRAIGGFFEQHGDVATFGYPVSREFTFLGASVQLFQRAALEVQSEGSVRVLNLTEQPFLPYTQLAGSTLPTADPALVYATPDPNTPGYASRLTEFIRATVPDSWRGQPVQFLTTVGESAPDLQVWGLPTSFPAVDPRNPHMVYQRFQDGILAYDATSGSTQGLLLGSYLKAVLTGQDLPADLATLAADSPLLRQYTPDRPLGLAQPARLPDTDLTDAFEPDVS